MSEPKRKITVYSNGTTYEIEEDQLYEPFPKTKSQEPREKNKGYNEKEEIRKDSE